MEYSEFLQLIKEKVQQRGGKQIRVAVSPVIKTNLGSIDSMTILGEGEVVTPTIYLGEYYQKLQEGSSLEEVTDGIWNVYQESYHAVRMDLSCFTDFELARHQIACKLIHYEMNRELLTQIPYLRFLDLAVVFYYRIDQEPFERGSILIQNTHLEQWKIDRETLREIAVSNTLRSFPCELLPLERLLEETLGMPVETSISQQIPMYVLSNSEKYFGAVHMVLADSLHKVADSLDSDFYILPSSIHECMILPVSVWMDPQELQCMVQEVNLEHVAPDEVLGDRVYRYERKSGMVVDCIGGDAAMPET